VQTVYVGDTVRQRRLVRESPKIRVITAAKVIAETLYCLETDESISARLGGV
jgi:phosphoribosylpyrophosphate synthetase